MKDLLEFLNSRLKFGVTLRPETPILSTGLMGSLKFFELLTELSERYNIEIDPTDVGADNFDTPSQIYRFLQEARGK